ncbi:hypothetical protein MACH26_32030 [Planctobacterium marinum]|uniref:Tetratricopeptide repeat protein n=2 Tax=Planctobacterium marinum TaxID=1631968 RepID=A0AA48KSZ7_9ALTE|nr:hypothetical protein MACH26_32030 [Planctobacterium marinum]
MLLQGGYLSRITGYFTLWLNYQFTGLDVTWYHAVNVLIHALNTLAVFFLSKLFISHFSKDTKATEHAFWALIIAALWALHPLNSQPVIYIVQRLGSLVALFVFLTVIFYIKARLSTELTSKLIFTLLTLLCVIAGIFTKQNFFVVFLFLFCWEWLQSKGKLRCYLNRLMLGGAILVVLIAPFPFMEAFWEKLDNFTRDPGATDRVSYFYTQGIVLWDYIARFVFPHPLQLEIFVPLRDSFDPLVALAFTAHLALIATALKLRATIPLFCWGVLFFYISHSVESFIFPIKDLAFEHRTYLGNFGLMLAVTGLARYWFDASPNRIVTSYITVLATLIVGLTGATLTYQRAIQWQDPLTFYERELKYSPEHIRTNASYGTELAKAGRLEEAEKYLKESIELNMAQGTISFGVLNAYMNVLYQQQKYQQAAPVVMMALRHVHYPERRSILLSNLAVGYIYMGYCDFALGLLEQALKLYPANQDAANNRNYCLKIQSGNQ